MSHTTPDKAILEYLANYGIGFYKDIAQIIDNYFVIEQDEKFADFKTRVLRFLDDLERHHFVKYGNTIITEDQIKIPAAIQAEGMKYIGRIANGPSDSLGTVITGGKNIINVRSPNSSSTISNTKRTNEKVGAFLEFIKKWRLVIGAMTATLALVFTFSKDIKFFIKNDLHTGDSINKNSNLDTAVKYEQVGNIEKTRDSLRHMDSIKQKLPKLPVALGSSVHTLTAQNKNDKKSQFHFFGDTTIIKAINPQLYKIYEYKAPNFFQLMVKPINNTWEEAFIGYPAEEDSFVHGQVNPEFGASPVISKYILPLQLNGKTYNVLFLVLLEHASPRGGVILLGDKRPSTLFFGSAKGDSKTIYGLTKF